MCNTILYIFVFLTVSTFLSSLTRITLILLYILLFTAQAIYILPQHIIMGLAGQP